jgi:hypothetical protein
MLDLQLVQEYVRSGLVFDIRLSGLAAMGVESNRIEVRILPSQMSKKDPYKWSSSGADDSLEVAIEKAMKDLPQPDMDSTVARPKSEVPTWDTMRAKRPPAAKRRR